MRPSFSARDNFLTAYSLRIASSLVENVSVYMTSTGSRDLVYLAPLPSLWSATLFVTSVVQPVYKEPSPQRTIYTKKSVLEDIH